MYFDATPMNMTILLVVTLALIAIVLLIRGRYDSNLPLLYFSAALAINVLSDRGLSPYLLYTGIAFALILRFEFMGKTFTRFIGVMTSLAMGLTIIGFLDQVF
jgi:hypothetical protein